MNRGRFLKTLLGIAVAPKVLAEVNIPPVPVKKSLLFTELNSMVPSYYPEMVAKYGTDHYAFIEQALWRGNHSTTEFYHYESPRGLIASITEQGK